MDNMRCGDVPANAYRTFAWTQGGQTTEITTNGLPAQLRVTTVANQAEPNGGPMYPNPLEGVGIVTCLVLAVIALCVIVNAVYVIFEIDKKLDALLAKKGKP